MSGRLRETKGQELERKIVEELSDFARRSVELRDDVRKLHAVQHLEEMGLKLDGQELEEAVRLIIFYEDLAS